ncbi:MAG: 3-dehydroquinate synthase, partial [Pseudomonadota bacterium]
MADTIAATAPSERSKVRVDLGARSYDILIGRGLVEDAGAEIAA